MANAFMCSCLDVRCRLNIAGIFLHRGVRVGETLLILTGGNNNHCSSVSTFLFEYASYHSMCFVVIVNIFLYTACMYRPDVSDRGTCVTLH